MLFNLYCGIIRRACVRVHNRGGVRIALQCCHQGILKHNIHDADASGDVLNIYCFSVSFCRCVEIIAKEGRSLKELYLVSCKITDHGRILSITVPLLQSTANIIIISIIAHIHHCDSGLIWFYSFPLMRLVNSENIIEKFQAEESSVSWSSSAHLPTLEFYQRFTFK